MTTHHTLIGGLRRLAMTTLTYAVAVVLVALSLPTILTPLPAAVFAPDRSPVVTRASTPPLSEVHP